MVQRPRPVPTEWVTLAAGDRLMWACLGCDLRLFYRKRHATVTCPVCDRMLQAADYDVDPHLPDHRNPDDVLRQIAHRRGKTLSQFRDEISPDPDPSSSLDW